MRLLDFRSGLRVAGHPVHAILLHFPLAFWALVFPLDLLGWWLGWELGWALSFWANALAVFCAIPTAVAGVIDLIAIRDPRAASVANRHMIVMLCAAAVFGAELFIRGGAHAPHSIGVPFALASSFIGTLLLLTGGWLGGELVFRHGVGRKDNDA